MRLIIEKLKIRNFKGLREQDIEFNELSTTICGENGTGKTTVVDAFNWLLFEKDSKGRTQFEIKTLENGEPIHGLEHSVEGIFKVDGRQLKLKKVYKEVWTKRKGDDQETFTGHEIERFVNDVPVKKMEYESKINELIDEKIFQLLTDPLYFSQKLHWKDRRKILFELAGEEISRDQIFKTNPQLRVIEKDLEDKTIEELKEALKYQRSQLNKARENIPVKINTLHETIKEVNKDALDIRIRSVRGSIKAIEEQMLDLSKLNEEKLKKQDELYKLKSRLKEIEHQTKQEIADPDQELKEQIMTFKSKIRELETELQMERRAASNLEKVILVGNKELERLREDYQFEANRKFEIDESIKECPTCKRPFSEVEIQSKVSELEENFKSFQVKELMRIRDKGQALAEDVKGYEEELEQVNKKIADLEREIQHIEKAIEDREKTIGTKPKPDIQTLLAENEEYKSIKARILELEADLTAKPDTVELNELKTKKARLEEELIELEKDLHQDEINQETRKRIEELMAEEKVLSQQIGEIEKKELIVDKYITTQAELIEKTINEKFNQVSFRLFKKQVNGGLDETCDVLVDGVPFDNANTAGQVNAGLDVINSLCKYHNTYTPIFIDNRESINDLIDTDSQLINLKVTRHKNLRVEQA